MSAKDELLYIIFGNCVNSLEIADYLAQLASECASGETDDAVELLEEMSEFIETHCADLDEEIGGHNGTNYVPASAGC